MTEEHKNHFKVLLSNLDEEDTITLTGIILENLYSTADITKIKRVKQSVSELNDRISTKYRDIKHNECRANGHTFEPWQRGEDTSIFIKDYEGDSHYEDYAVYERVCTNCGYREVKRISLEELKNYGKKKAKKR